MNTLWDDIKAIVSRPVVTLVILIVISLGICGIYANESDTGVVHIFQNAFSTITAPISKLGIYAKGGLSNVSDRLQDNFVSGDSLSDLKAENAKLKTQIIAMEKYKNEAERLQKLLNIKDQYKAEGIAAHVIGASNSAWNQTITISCGQDDDIHAGQTVLGTNGVVGQVISSNPIDSKVRLLTDPNSGVAVKIQSNNNNCILKGSLDGVLYLEGLDSNAQVQVGDIIVTSGLGGSYVEGLVVGSVSQIISSQSGVNKKIVVSPLEQNGSLDEVFVIKDAY